MTPFDKLRRQVAGWIALNAKCAEAFELECEMATARERLSQISLPMSVQIFGPRDRYFFEGRNT